MRDVNAPWTWKDTFWLCFWTFLGALIGIVLGIAAAIIMPWELVKAIKYLMRKP